MHDTLYEVRTIWIVCAVIGLMAAAFELGFQIGRPAHRTATDSARSQIATVQAALFTVIGLLLGFAFSQSLARHDSRSVAVVEEANAIGTAWLRSGLLAEPHRSEARALFAAYAAHRAEAAGVTMIDQDLRLRRFAEASEMQNAIWGLGARALAAEPDSAIARIYVQAVNEMIDAYGRQRAALDRHLPQFVIALLLGGFVMAAGTLGYGSGVGGHRAAVTTFGLVLVVGMVCFIVLDLDRPRRGVIEVSQKSLIELRDSIAASR